LEGGDLCPTFAMSIRNNSTVDTRKKRKRNIVLTIKIKKGKKLWQRLQ
jgi:hypothetical protein